MSSRLVYDQEYNRFVSQEPFLMSAYWNAVRNSTTLPTPDILVRPWEQPGLTQEVLRNTTVQESEKLFRPLPVPVDPKWKQYDELIEPDPNDPRPAYQRLVTKAFREDSTRTTISTKYCPDMKCVGKKPIPPGKARSVTWKPRTRKMPWPTAEREPDQLEDPKWSQALTKWQNIAEEAGAENSELARLINKHKLSGQQVEDRFQRAVQDDIQHNEEVSDLLEDTFAGKSASTLNGRAGALLMYMRWTKSLNLKAFPLTEEVCYAYVKSCRIEHAPATRAFEARKAWRLATILLGLDSGMNIFKSARIEGCIRRCYKKKRMTKRSVPLHKKSGNGLREGSCPRPRPGKSK
jgi:hypothetical protein